MTTAMCRMHNAQVDEDSMWADVQDTLDVKATGVTRWKNKLSRTECHYALRRCRTRNSGSWKKH